MFITLEATLFLAFKLIQKTIAVCYCASTVFVAGVKKLVQAPEIAEVLCFCFWTINLLEINIYVVDNLGSRLTTLVSIDYVLLWL